MASTQRFIITGGKKLKGTVSVSGSKNATLPILAASLMTSDITTLENVPDIADVHTMIKLLKAIGAKVTFARHRLVIDTTKTKYKPLGHEVCHLRGSIVLLAPMLARFGEVRMQFPGGCVLGRRSISAHLEALQSFGARVQHSTDYLHFKVKKLKGVSSLLMPQMSVTATENAIMAAVLAEGKTQINLAAAEPHVQDLCEFLNECGAKITGIGTHIVTIVGVKKLHGTHHTITPDYLEAGTLVLAGVLTQGAVTVTNFVPNHLDALWDKLKACGVQFTVDTDSVTLNPPHRFRSLRGPWLDTRVYPGFPTDLQAPFAVLLTQLPGPTKIFETLFEGRLVYLAELEKMGAKVETLNAHQAIVRGPTKLTGTEVSSCDIRAGAAMVLAGLIATGKTTIYDINYTDRGYEQLDVKLKSLGAQIKRLKR